MAATEGLTPRERWALLAAAAAALQGATAAAQDGSLRKESPAVSYQYGRYDEGGPRMHVRVHQIAVSAPVGDRYEVRFGATRDVMSGASVFSYIQAQGQTRAIRTSATIHDRRDVAEATAAWYGEYDYVSVNGGRSIENDYEARFVNLAWRREFNEKNTVLSVAAGHSDDITWEKYYPLQVGSVPEVFRHRRSTTLLAGVSQVIDDASVAQLHLGHVRQEGWLDDQYRRPAVMVGFVPTFVAEGRPPRRQWTALARWSRYVRALDSAVHVDWRYGHDSWGAHSQMVELKWRWDAGRGWIVGPGVRGYAQKAASFYDVHFAQGTPAPRTSDSRLASFRAVSAKLEVTKAFADGASLRLSLEDYERRKGSGRGTELDNHRARTLATSLEYPF